ncbi:hypothetical protein KAR91_72735 [Candidatus Pacearchaeota archaeon]|nr:hypothetical protein [Candidatus Pacearchaeota archaeon]
MTHSTMEKAKKAAQVSLDAYREDAKCGEWDDDVEQVCWGEISRAAKMFTLDAIVETDEGPVNCVDYQLITPKDP